MSEYFSEAAILGFFESSAYSPMTVYLIVIGLMTASSFGLPVPEEFTLVSAGLVAYMAQNPDQYPPPTPDAEGVNLIVLSVVCFISVLGSDVLIYTIGKVYGKKVVASKFFNKRIGKERFEKINATFNKYKFWACGIFRFAPGVRFPGHMTCGLMGVPLWQFLLVDGTAALVSVPTQVLLVAHYGKVITERFAEFKIILGSIILVIFLIWLVRKFIKKRQNSQAV